MPRTVSTVVCWVLNALVWDLWFTAMQALWNRPGNVTFGIVIGFFCFLAAEPLRLVLTERKAARREGRAPASLYALADRPTHLRPVPQGIALARHLAAGFAYNVAVLLVAGGLFGERLHRFPTLPLVLLALSTVARIYVTEQSACAWHPRPRPNP